MNSSNKRITFPSFDFSIGPNENKDVTDDMVSHILSYPDISLVEKKIETIKVEKKEDKVEKVEEVDEKKDVFKFKGRHHTEI